MIKQSEKSRLIPSLFEFSFFYLFFFQYEVSHLSCIGRKNERERERNERQLVDSARESSASYPEETQAGTHH